MRNRFVRPVTVELSGSVGISSCQVPSSLLFEKRSSLIVPVDSGGMLRQLLFSDGTWPGLGRKLLEVGAGRNCVVG